MYVGERIRARLKAEKKDQRELAAFLHKDESAISRKLDGKSPLTIDELNRIAEFFDPPCEISDFFPPKLGDKVQETLASVPFTDFVRFLIQDEVQRYCDQIVAGKLSGEQRAKGRAV